MERYNLDLDFKGKTTPSNTPYLKIKIKGVNFENYEVLKNGFDAILDTGAVKSHITPQFAELLNLTPLREEVGLYPLKDGVSKTSVYKIDFYINGIEQTFTEDFNVLPNIFPFPIILGTEFLSKCESLNIDFINHNYSLRL